VCVCVCVCVLFFDVIDATVLLFKSHLGYICF